VWLSFGPVRCAADFQDCDGLSRQKAERQTYSRFFYRFPNGESGADVYDRLTVFQDHMVRDMHSGRFADNTSIVIVTHGLALRVFLSRWLHWTVSQCESVYNPPNCAPLVLERAAAQAPAGAADAAGAEESGACASAAGGGCRAPTCTKSLYTLTPASLALLRAEDAALGAMMPPEQAWARMLRVSSGGTTAAGGDA
jgi:hypothetical protein